MNTPFALIILDGLAHNPNPRGNAVQQANTPNLDRIRQEYPMTELTTFGERVGLPDDQMGNSEVGHLNIGAGRVVEQELTRINRAVRQQTLVNVPELRELLAACKTSGSALHLAGLVSHGGVHSSQQHLYALVETAAKAEVPFVVIHVITDGRDRPTTASIEELSELLNFLNEISKKYPNTSVYLGSIIGRYWAMDRDKRWDRVTKAYQLWTEGKGAMFQDPLAGIAEQHAAGTTDEFLAPMFNSSKGTARPLTLENGDSLLFFNFRSDRMRQIVASFLGDKIGFDSFARSKVVKLSILATLTEYNDKFPTSVLFKPFVVKNHFGDIVSAAGLRQLRIAETEKYPHVTYFFNGTVETPTPGENRRMVQSPKEVATYDLKPEMSAYGVTDVLLQELANDSFDVLVVNYANCDMVGHTGNFNAAVRAVEVVDECLGKVLAALLERGGVAIVTADHGNADQMVDYDTGEPHTFHTKHPVPLVLVGERFKGRKLRSGGALCDIAPTACELLGIPQPADMTGQTLLLKD